MPSLRSGLIILAPEPKPSGQTNPPPEQLLDDSMTGEQFNHETVTTRPEEVNKSLTGDTGIEQGDAKSPGEQEEISLTVAESATEFSGSTSACAARVTVEAPSNSQQSDSISDDPTDISAESEFLPLGEPNGEAAFDADFHFRIFLEESLVVDITPAAASTSNDTSFADGSQVQPDADPWVLVPAESRHESPHGSASSQPPLSTGVQVAKCVEFDVSGPGETFPETTGNDIGSAIMIEGEEAEQTAQPGSAMMSIAEDTEEISQPDSAIVILDDVTEQTAKAESTKLRRNSPRNAAKRSFKDFVANDNLWMGQISEDLDGIMELTDYVLEMSEKVVKRARTIKKQLVESQRYIRDCGGEEMKVTGRLEKL